MAAIDIDQDVLRDYAAIYVRSLKEVKAEQPLLSRLQNERRLAEQFLLAHIPFGSDERDYRQNGQRWIMNTISLQKPPLTRHLETRMIGKFTEAEKDIFRASQNAMRSELRVLTSIDFDRMDDSNLDGVLILDGPFHDDFFDKGEALYKFRKAAYECREQQTKVSVSRSRMREYEKRLKAEAPTDFEITVDGVTVSLGKRMMGLTVPLLRQHLLDQGLSRQNVEMYLSIRRRPVWERRVNDVMLFIDGIDQPCNVFGVYRRPCVPDRETIIID